MRCFGDVRNGRELGDDDLVISGECQSVIFILPAAGLALTERRNRFSLILSLEATAWRFA
jgi:hypothetical protein